MLQHRPDLISAPDTDTASRSSLRQERRAGRRRRRTIAGGLATLITVAGGGWAIVNSEVGADPSVQVLDDPPLPYATGGAGLPEGADQAKQDKANAPAEQDAAARRSGSAPSAPQSSSAAKLPPLPWAFGAKLSWDSPVQDVRHDQGISVSLDDGRSLWIFADTTQVSRPPFFFVTSSAAVSARGSEHLLHASNALKLPIEFLPRTLVERLTQVSGVSYAAIWPTGATLVPDGRIIISYAKYDVTINPQTFTFRSAGLFEYRYRGIWTMRRASSARRIADGIWSAADGAVGSPVYSSGQVYFTQCEQLECYSLRTTPGSITDRSSYTWWTGKGWSSQRAARKAMSYGGSRPGVTPSIVYLPQMGVYATTGTAAGSSSQTGLLWVAPNPWGPWSRPASFALPQCPAAGCYTLNLHPLESTGNRVRISYATAGTGPYVRVVDLAVKLGARGSKISVS